MKAPGPPAANPEQYIDALDGWRGERVALLRSIAGRVGGTVETIKWGHLVYLANGPAFLVRAEEDRVLFGFWRGKRMLDIEPRLRGTSRYEMRSLELRAESPIDPSVAEHLIREAIALNHRLGDPTGAGR